MIMGYSPAILSERGIAIGAVALCAASLNAQSPAPRFNVVAFYTGRSDLAHIGFKLP